MAHLFLQLHASSGGFDNRQIGVNFQALAFQSNAQKILLGNSAYTELRGVVVNYALEVLYCGLSMSRIFWAPRAA